MKIMLISLFYHKSCLIKALAYFKLTSKSDKLVEKHEKSYPGLDHQSRASDVGIFRPQKRKII